MKVLLLSLGLAAALSSQARLPRGPRARELESASAALGVRAPWNAPKWVWKRAYRSHRALLPLLLVIDGAAKDDGLARTPPMGWSSWNCFRTDVDEAKLLAAADALADSGLASLGYTVVWLDAGWWATEFHIPHLKARPEVELTGVCRLGAAELALVRERFGFGYAAQDFRDVLAHAEADGVVIAIDKPQQPRRHRSGSHLAAAKGL